jgi:hypothetical protein
MSFWIEQAKEIRAARGEVLLDGRKRLTRWISWRQNNETQPQLQYTYGDADAFSGTAPTGWTGLLLAKIEADNSPANNGAGNDPVIQLTYETPGTVIQRDETKNNGALLVRTIVSFWTTPATPSGYTLISTNTENVNGFAYKTYTFAKGDGEVSRTTSYSQNGTTVDGTVGVSRLDIDYLTVPGAAEPTWSGVSGYVKISVTNREADGHEVWSAVFAKGDGIVSQTDEERNNGKLLLRTIVELGAAPATPATYTLVNSATRQEAGHVVYTYAFAKGDGEISRETDHTQCGTTVDGTTGVTRLTIRYLTAPGASEPTWSGVSGYVQVSISNAEQEGHEVWVALYAKGDGIVSQTDETRNNGALLIRTIVELGSIPSTPATYTLVSVASRDEAGHTVYTSQFAKGSGEIGRTIDYSQSDDQGTTGITRTVIRYLVAPSATVLPTSLSGSVEIGRDYQELDGHRIWITTWAKGTGLIVDEMVESVSGALVIYHRVALGAAPSAPVATISGTVTLFDESVKKDSGYDVYDYRWAEGNGQAGIETRADPDGALIYSITDYDAASATPAYPGGGTGYLVSRSHSPESGYFRNTAVYKKPPASQTRRQTVNWQKPGLASFTSNQLTLSPPATRTLLASVEVTYSTTQDTTDPYEVEAYANLVESWTPTDTGIAESRQRGLGGYLAGSSSISGSASNYNGVLCDTWSAVLVSSIPSTSPSGTLLLSVDNDPYITATDGTTIVWRITKTSVAL